MPFRNAKYLDLQLLQNVADYFGIELEVEAKVTRRSLDERTRRAGVSRVVAIGGEKGETEEVTTEYSTAIRPIRALNDVVDTLLANESIVDLTIDAQLPIGHRDLVQVTGEAILSPVTEAAAMISVMIPLFLEQVQQGNDPQTLDPVAVGQAILTSRPDFELVHVFALSTDIPDLDMYLLITPNHLFGGAVIEDIEGEVTLVGTIDKIVPTGSSYSLQRHLLPGLNRTLRRAIGPQSIAELLKSFNNVLASPLSEKTLSIEGPAALITPISIY